MSYSHLNSIPNYFPNELTNLSASEPNLRKENHYFRNSLKKQLLGRVSYYEKNDQDYSNKDLKHIPKSFASSTNSSTFYIKKSENEHLNDIKKEIDQLSENNIQDLTHHLINLPVNSQLRVKMALDLLFPNRIDDNLFNQKFQQLNQIINCEISNENIQFDENFEDDKNRIDQFVPKSNEFDECKLYNRAKNPYLIKKFQQRSENDPLYKLLRNTKYILNRLTVQNFEKLSIEFLNLPIEDEDNLRLIIDLIYEQSIDQQLFSWIYARLCKILVDIKVVKNLEPNKKTGFLELLREKTQLEFETDFYHDINYDQLIIDIDPECTQSNRKKIKHLAEEKLAKIKQKSLGNVKFIGELFKLDLLTEENINSFIEYLLTDETSLKNLECTCMLLKTVGKYINENKLNYYMDKLIKTSNKSHGSLNTRIRFMIMDLIDLNKNGWTKRRVENQYDNELSLEKESKTSSIEMANKIKHVKEITSKLANPDLLMSICFGIGSGLSLNNKSTKYHYSDDVNQQEKQNEKDNKLSVENITEPLE